MTSSHTPEYFIASAHHSSVRCCSYTRQQHQTHHAAAAPGKLMGQSPSCMPKQACLMLPCSAHALGGPPRSPEPPASIRHAAPRREPHAACAHMMRRVSAEPARTLPQPHAAPEPAQHGRRPRRVTSARPAAAPAQCARRRRRRRRPRRPARRPARPRLRARRPRRGPARRAPPPPPPASSGSAL